MTENEAKQKWCPFVRVVIGPDNPTWQGQMLTNRGDIPADDTHTCCIGAECMAWRWARSPETAKFLNEGRKERNEAPVEASGYCGLAEIAQ